MFWQHGAPRLGEPPEPLVEPAAELGLRWIAHDRPGYGGSTSQPGRDISAVAGDVAQIADACGVRSLRGSRRAGAGRRCDGSPTRANTTR